MTNNKKNNTSLLDKIKQNRWSVFGLVVLSAIITTAYIDNVFRVNNLLTDIGRLEKEFEELRTSNEMLNSNVIRLQSAERITRIAEEKLMMKKPTKAPIIIK